MALWVQLKPGRVRWFTSKNLVDWEFASDLMRDWAFECMDVVFLPVDGDKNNMKCVIYDASFDYEVGTFDGKQFHSETKPLINMRGNFYAAQTFTDAPGGRIIQIGWMRTHHNVAAQFGLPFNQQMAFPCELTLHQTKDGPRLRCYPIHEIDSLVTGEYKATDTHLNRDQNWIEGQSDLDLVDLDVTFKPSDSSVVTIQLPKVTLRYDASTQRIEHQGINDKGESAWMTTLENVAPIDGVVELRFLVDRMTVEAYAHRGEMFGAYYLHPDNNPKEYSIRSSDSIQVQSLNLRKLRSSWK
jgi:sucrose-6-phosphate hydrolase SacC (GH32 family)